MGADMIGYKVCADEVNEKMQKSDETEGAPALLCVSCVVCVCV